MRKKSADFAGMWQAEAQVERPPIADFHFWRLAVSIAAGWCVFAGIVWLLLWVK